MALNPNTTDNQRDKPKSGDRARNLGKGNRVGGEQPGSPDDFLQRGKASAEDQTSFTSTSNERRVTKPGKARVG